MMSWRKILFLILVAACVLGMTTACGWRDFGNDDPVAAGQPSTIGGFTPEEIQGIIETARSERANVTLPITFPAASFYRFDLKNEKGANRLSTILSYADVLSTPTYGLESTARVLLYEAQRDALNYDFDYFTFERALPVNAVTGVVNAMARRFGDVEFLLRSNVPIGAAPEVASAVRAVLPTLPRPTPASLTVQMLGTGPVDIDLKPRFSVLDNATLMTLIFNDEMRALFAKLSQDGLASSPYFFSNVPMAPHLSRKLNARGASRFGADTFLMGPVQATVQPDVTPSPTGTDNPLVAHLVGTASGTALQVVWQGPAFQVGAWKTWQTSKVLTLEKVPDCSNTKYELKETSVYTSNGAYLMQGCSAAMPSFTVGEARITASKDGVVLGTAIVRSGETAYLTLDPAPTGTITVTGTIGASAPGNAASLSLADEGMARLREFIAFEQIEAPHSVVDYDHNLHPVSSFLPNPPSLRVISTASGTGRDILVLNTDLTVTPTDMAVSGFRPVVATAGPEPLEIVVSGSGFTADTGIRLTRAGFPPIVAGAVTLAGPGELRGQMSLASATPGPWTVEVFKPNGETAVGAARFTATGLAPMITAISPSRAPGNGVLRNVTVTGANLLLGTRISLTRTGFPAVAATSVVWKDGRTVTCAFDLTGLATGAWNIEAIGGDGLRTETAGLFTILAPPPVISGFTPASVPNNAARDGFAIDGSWFVSGLNVRLVRAGAAAIAGSVTSVTPAKIGCRFDLTGTATGSWRIEVVNPDGQVGTSVTSLSVYAPVPAVHAITPQTGENEGIMGGCRIAGSGFLPGARVQLTKAGKNPVTAAGVQYTGSSLLTCDFDLTGIAIGTWSVQVRNSDGQAATGTGLFTVLPSPSRPAPAVAGIQPSAYENIGRQTGVTITGTGFRSGASVVLTRSGQAPVPADTVSVADATRLTCAFDATRMTPGSWSVTVMNADDQAGTGRDILTIELAGPAIATMTPAAGSIIGTATVTVTGTGFQPGTTLKLVTGTTEVAATGVVVNGWTSITGTFDLRGLATGTFGVRATNPDGKQYLAANAFRVLAMPPSVGPAVNPTSTYRTTTTFTLGGAHFQPGATVRLLSGINNPYSARSVVVNSPTSLTFVLDLPRTFPSGMWDVEVTNPDGQKGVRPGLIQLQNVGLLVTTHTGNVSPAIGFNDRSLTVSFTADDWLDRYVDFIYLQRDGYATVKATSMNLAFRNYSCTFDLSGVATGTWRFYVHLLDGRSDSGGTIQVVPPPPLVTGVSPNSGIGTGPKVVNIGGYGFTRDSSVRLFRTSCTPIPGTIETVISSASMDCRFDLTGAEAAPWDIVVTNPQGLVATMPAGFMILPPTATYASMTPAFGANTNSAFALQITGAGFKDGTGVYLERDQRVVQAQSVVRSGYYQLTATFDLTDLAVGPWTLGLEVPGEAPLIAPDTFLVKSQPPTITSITPVFGLNEAASTTVTIRGTGFHPGILVRLMRDAQLPIAGTDVALNSSTELTCDFALAGKALGAWTPVVENADGGLGSLAGAFTVYLASPVVTSVSVSTGKVYTNLALPINGSGFADGATVRLMNASFTIAATQVVRTSTSLLTASFPGENLRPGVFGVEVKNPNSLAALGQNLVTISDLPPVVHLASPSSGMNDRVVAVTLTGLSFQAGSQFRLTRTGHTSVSAVDPVVTLFMPRPYSPYTIQTDKISGNINLTGLATGAWNVEVINPDGQAGSKAGAFTVQKAVASPPTVTAVSPNTGFNIGVLQNVQITGTHFAAGASVRMTRASYAAVAGSDVTVTGSDTLTCSFDLAGVATGTWNVETTNPDGQTATGANLLTVVSPAWKKSIGGTGAESDLFCAAAPEGDYYVAGTTSSSDGDMVGFNGGTTDVWIARVSNAGAIVWSKCFGGTGNDACSALVVIPGGFVLAGDTTSPDGPLCPGTPDATKRAWAAEFDTTGTFVRVNHFALPSQSQPSDARGGLRKTADGGFILAGTVSDGAYWYGWAVKFDALLQEQWQQRLAANSGMAYSYDVAQKPDGNFLLCGYTEFGAGAFAGTGYHASNDGFVFELASDTGSPVRGICLGGTGSDRCTGIVPLSDGGFYAIGTTGSSDGTCPSANGGSDVMIVKLQSDFTIAWAKSVGGSQSEEGFRGKLAADGDLLYMGRTTSTDGDCVGNHSLFSDFWLGKCSPTGSLQWQRFFGGGLEDIVTDVVLAPDGGYLIGGYGRSDDGDFAGIGHRTENSEFVLIREPEAITQ